MRSLGVSNGPPGPGVQEWNDIACFHSSGDQYVFVLRYEDPDTHKIRFKEGKPDEFRFIVNDLSALAQLGALAANAISDQVEKAASLALFKESEAKHHG